LAKTYTTENLYQTYIHGPIDISRRIIMHTATSAASRSCSHWTGISQLL